MRWQDSRGINKVQQVVHKDSGGKSSNGKGKRATEQPPNPPNSRRAVPLPRVSDRLPILASTLSRVLIALTEADYCPRDVGERVQMVGRASRVAVPPMQLVESRSRMHTVENVTPRQGTHRPPIARTNYISQNNDDDEPQQRQNTGQGQPVSCKRQCVHALTSPSQCSRFQRPNWPPKNSQWDSSAKWPIPSSANKASRSNIDTWLPIPRHGPHGPTLTATSLDGLHKECPAKWREWTQSSFSPGTGYQGQEQKTSRMASSLA